MTLLIRPLSSNFDILGARAAQLVPHIHFHIIPRRPTDSTPSAGKASWVMFGRGPRDELDDDEGRVLAKEMREELAREVKQIRETEGIDLDVDDRGRL
jgi:diadenosine tetraphosphate (Ap4A) HIT family hydrolase